MAGKAENSEPLSKGAESTMTSKQLTEAHHSLSFTSGRRAGSHVVRHKVRVNHLRVGSQGLRREGILAALEEKAAKVHDSLLCTCTALHCIAHVSVPVWKRREQACKFSRPRCDQLPDVYSCDFVRVGTFVVQCFLVQQQLAFSSVP